MKRALEESLQGAIAGLIMLAIFIAISAVVPLAPYPQ